MMRIELIGGAAVLEAAGETKRPILSSHMQPVRSSSLTSMTVSFSPMILPTPQKNLPLAVVEI